tara:strand:+ start:430 stop:627 length:198 start_codon:yes stop_codon:yes gene_type:complete
MGKKLTIEEIDKKIWEVESYYPNGHKAGSEEMLSWDLRDRMYLGRLYKLRQKREKQQKEKGVNSD